MGRGGLVGFLGSMIIGTIDAAFTVSRKAATERKRQDRAAENFRKRQLRAAEREQRRQITAEENEKRKIGNSAQRLADMVNKSLLISRSTPNLTTKLNKLNTAQQKIDQLKHMTKLYPYLTLYDILPIETEILQMHAETERERQNLVIEKATLAAEKRQRERDKKMTPRKTTSIKRVAGKNEGGDIHGYDCSDQRQQTLHRNRPGETNTISIRQDSGSCKHAGKYSY